MLNSFRGVTNPEYLPPKQLLPIENAPIPLPNLSATPIPPLIEAKPFLHNPYSNSISPVRFVPIMYDNQSELEMPLINYQSSSHYTKSNTSNVEVIQSFPISEFQHTTIENNFATEIYQYTTTVLPEQMSIITSYTNQNNPKDSFTSRKPYVDLADTPVPHKSESNVRPLVVNYHNFTINDIMHSSKNVSSELTNKNSQFKKAQQTVNSRKPIQYIIPYTTQQKPSPFRAKHLRSQSDLQNGVTETLENMQTDEWSPFRTIDQELHDPQESVIVTATAETPSSTPVPRYKGTKYVAKFLASSIRELLNKEKVEDYHSEEKSVEKVPFDLTTLQHNIDEWTEMQFSTINEKLTTVATSKYTKPIPVEYLTDSPLFPKVCSLIYPIYYLLDFITYKNV